MPTTDDRGAAALTPFAIATFNVKDFFLPRTDAERAIAPAKVRNLAENLKRANADVVALQEVAEPEPLAELLSQVSDLGYGPPVLGTTDDRGIRNAILSRLPILESKVHTSTSLPLPEFVEGDAMPYADRISLRRGIVHVRVRTGSREISEIDILTAHLKSNLPVRKRTLDGREIQDTTARTRAESGLRSLVRRAAEAVFVRGLVDNLMGPAQGRAVCVLGDLNDQAEALPVRIIRGIDSPSEHTLYACAELMPAAKRYSCLHRNDKLLIDHILVSKPLFRSAKRFAIFNESLRYQGPHRVGESAPPTIDSDHALCMAQFEI